MCVLLQMARGCWWYYFSKFTEFFDTVSTINMSSIDFSQRFKKCNMTVLFWQIFFVLRKKNDHISTLHVIHHGVMPMSVWFGVKFTPGGYIIEHVLSVDCGLLGSDVI